MLLHQWPFIPFPVLNAPEKLLVYNMLLLAIIYLSSQVNYYFLVQIGDRVITHREPNPDEARIQAMSVVAACAKGLMYFQSEVSLTRSA